MVSFRFPFSFSQPPNPKPPNATASNFSTASFSSTAAAVAVSAGFAAAVACSKNPTNSFLENPLNFLLSNVGLSRNHFSPLWGSLILSDTSAPVTESRTGMPFPSVVKDSQRLLGIGLRKKAILGLKNIDVYAFGVYADHVDVKNYLGDKYGTVSASGLKEKELKEDLMERDICMTIRLQIVYGRLSIKSVRRAFEQSVGSRLQKFGGTNNKDLLERFTSQFKDEYKIPRGSIIDLSRDRGHVLRTTSKIDLQGHFFVDLVNFLQYSNFKSQIRKFFMLRIENKDPSLPRYMCQSQDVIAEILDNKMHPEGYLIVDGKEVGSIESKLLCRSILDLYIGDEPFDQKAKDEVEQNLAFLLKK